jgi:hypothetical protein
MNVSGRKQTILPMECYLSGHPLPVASENMPVLVPAKILILVCKKAQ